MGGRIPIGGTDRRGMYLCVGRWYPWLCWSWGHVGVKRDLPLLFSISPLFCPTSVLVPLIRSTKEMTK